MVASIKSALLVLALVCLSRVAAIQKTIGHVQTHRQQGTVCISLAAYEEPVWIDILLQNVLRFTDCSTKVALHLNAETNYSSEDIGKFSKTSTRISVNPERISVRWGTGSILHAHVLNAMHMRKVWGNECSYWVLQASNMLWIKPGMEPYVNEFRISGMIKRHYGPCDKYCEWKGWSEDHRAWEHPEGTFVPMSLMNNFVGDYMKWFNTFPDPDWGFLHKGNGKEEDWLQSYAWNDEGHVPVGGPTVCERLGPDERLGVAEVKEMIKGSLDEKYKHSKAYYDGHEDFCASTDAKFMAPFAVKVNSGPADDNPCVTRDPNSDVAKWLDLTASPYEDPVIKYILHLTIDAPMLNEGTSCHGAA